MAVASDGLAQIVYTSGTESLPKGAMLTHDAVLWQYVSCIIDAEIDASDVILHALPMYHCAQLDVFLGPGDLPGRDQHHRVQPDAGDRAAADRRAPDHFVLRAADGLDRPAAVAAVRRARSLVASQGLLRRVDHAGRGAAGDAAARAGTATLEPVRPDRNRAAGHRARPGRAAAQARIVRPARPERRDARRRRRR